MTAVPGGKTTMIDTKSAGEVAIDRLDVLAGFTEEPGRLTRLYLSPSTRRRLSRCSPGCGKRG